jgi:hypothetical protein
VSEKPVDAGLDGPPRRLLRGTRQLAYLVGKRLLVGVTYVDPDGTVLGRDQFCGTVLEVVDGVVVVERPGEDEPAVLPAEHTAYERAPRGTYTLTRSGESVINPDMMTTWTVVVEELPPGVPVAE